MIPEDMAPFSSLIALAAHYSSTVAALSGRTMLGVWAAGIKARANENRPAGGAAGGFAACEASQCS
jgi:hypothetical protein